MRNNTLAKTKTKAKGQKMDIKYGLYICTAKEAKELSHKDTCAFCKKTIAFAEKNNYKVIVSRDDWHALGVEVA